MNIHAKVSNKNGFLSSAQAIAALANAGLVVWARGADPAKSSRQLHLTVSSERIGSSSLFLMFAGTKVDRHDFAGEAVAKGCRFLVGDDAKKLESVINQLPDELKKETSVICVLSGRAAWAALEHESACRLTSESPPKSLRMAGVTGTNGKTSTVWLLRGILRAMGVDTASAGTLGFFAGNERTPSNHTSPDPDVLYPWLADISARGTEICAMEVSSHSLAQEKLFPVQFEVAVFTSFSRDHLDFHGTEDDYFASKLRLFSERLASDGRMILHASVAKKVLDRLSASRQTPTSDIWIYGLGLNHDEWPGKNTVSVSIMSTRPGGTMIKLSFAEFAKDRRHTIEVEVPVFGHVFVENATAAVIAAGKLAGMWPSASHFEQIKPVPGRMELAGNSPSVFVDYAHTPDALEKALEIVRQIRGSGPGKIWCIFGCGGDRDRGKRPLMGSIAARLADRVVITSDNPRSEDPDAILDDIERGFARTLHSHDVAAKCLRLSERADAIMAAVREAGADDLVLIAGKGHEDYQEIAGVKHWFDDRVEAQSALHWRMSPSHALVIGSGVSGLAAARLAIQRGMSAAISERGKLTPELKAQLEEAGVRCLDGGHSLAHLEGMDLVVLSPGVRPDHEIVKEAKRRAIPVRSEIDFALRDFSGRLVVVTGTNGKSTIVTMIGHLLEKLGVAVSVGGNIGDPPCDMVARGDLASTLVLEMSSYQLEQGMTPRAQVAIFSSFSHDHMERHGTARAYFKAKWKCFEGITDGGLCLLTKEVAGSAQNFGLRVPGRASAAEVPGISSSGPDTINSELAIRAVQHLEPKASREELSRGLSDFAGLPYRRQIIGHLGGKAVINDSKSTNCESTCAALGAITAEDRVVVMMGGKGKGETYRDLLAFKDRIEVLVCFGESGQTIADELCSVLPVQVFARMSLAASAAARIAAGRNCGILFSPGCASFDEFRNFEHRGQEFNHAISQWLDAAK